VVRNYLYGTAQVDDNNSSSSSLPQKRGRPRTSWDLEAEGPAEDSSYTCHQGPAQDIKCIYNSMKQSGEARPITAQRLHPHPALEHGALVQEMLGSREQEQFKGREQLGTQHNSHSMQQIEQQYEESAEGREDSAIPRTLTKRQRLMVRTDMDGGVIKCKLCPTVELSSWQCFRRHCDASEDHLVELTFCDRCGDYLAAETRKGVTNGRESTKRTPA
jgi:hypothetical protein